MKAIGNGEDWGIVTGSQSYVVEYGGPRSSVFFFLSIRNWDFNANSPNF